MTDRISGDGLEKKIRSHVTLDEGLLKRVKRQAASEGRSFSSFVERSIILQLKPRAKMPVLISWRSK